MSQDIRGLAICEVQANKEEDETDQNLDKAITSEEQSSEGAGGE